jgi:hypothetical protein
MEKKAYTTKKRKSEGQAKTEARKIDEKSTTK